MQEAQGTGIDDWISKILWRRVWQPTLVFMPGESHGKRSLVVYDPQGRKESDTTEVTQQARTITYHLLISIFLAFSFLLQFKNLTLLESHQYFDSQFLKTIMFIICTGWLLNFMYIQSLMIKLNCFCGIIRNIFLISISDS